MDLSETAIAHAILINTDAVEELSEYIIAMEEGDQDEMRIPLDTMRSLHQKMLSLLEVIHDAQLVSPEELNRVKREKELLVHIKEDALAQIMDEVPDYLVAAMLDKALPVLIDPSPEYRQSLIDHILKAAHGEKERKLELLEGARDFFEFHLRGLVAANMKKPQLLH